MLLRQVAMTTLLFASWTPSTELRRGYVKIYQYPYSSVEETFILSMTVTEKLGLYSPEDYI